MDLSLEGQDISKFLPGQFLHIKCGAETLLRRPISICDIDREKQSLNILYRSEGKGTQLLSEMQAGQKADVLGPLGNGFPTDTISAGKTALMVGGGIGVPPLYYLAKELKAKGVKIKAIIGFSSAKDVFLEKEFAELGEVYVTTIDGSHGHHGLVTDLFTAPGETLSPEHTASSNPDLKPEDTIGAWDSLFTCGPTAMLKAIQNKIPNKDNNQIKIDAYMSLEERMGCGVGACLACVCHPTELVGKDLDAWEKPYQKICCDGPVFDLQEVAL